MLKLSPSSGPAARPAPKGYLETLHGCALYVLILANEYGQLDGELSATHHEYRLAQKLKLPTIVFLKDFTGSGVVFRQFKINIFKVFGSSKFHDNVVLLQI